MHHKIRYLRQTDLGTECDACGGRVDLVRGGVCEQCRRILCEQHLHGSWLRRMIHEFRRPIVCVACRAGAERTAG